MNLKLLLERLPEPIRRRPLMLGALPVLLGLALLYWLFRPAHADLSSTACFEVKRGDLTVSVVEGGTLAAVSEISIRNQVEGTARIISIVPEGSYAKAGDLLVELDSAQARDQVNQQEINLEKAKFAVEQSKAQLEIQRSATNSDYLAALLKVRFAKIDRDKYQQGQRLVDLVEASNKLVQARAQFAVNFDAYRNSTNLAAKGYETKQKVDGDWLSVMNNQNALLVASNSIWLLEEFDVPKLKEKYDSDVMQAEQELDRVVSQNKRRMAQYEADLVSQINTLKLSEEKLKRDKANLEATKIYAPQDGLVVYQVSDNHFSSESLIEGGAIVRNRQELIKLPDLSRMKVTIKVHESHVNMVQPGQPAFVVLSSMPDQRFRGVVEKVAPLPDTQARWGNPNLRVYNTEIYIIDPLPNVKPGVSASAEVVVTNIADALSVPIQAVTTYKGKQVAYVVRGSHTEPRPVEVGLYNTQFIEVIKGLEPGDRVLLSPPFDTEQKDLGGEIVTAEEARKLTNAPVRSLPANRDAGRPGTRPGREDRETRGPGGADPQRPRAARTANGEELGPRLGQSQDGPPNESGREANRGELGGRHEGQERGPRPGGNPARPVGGPGDAGRRTAAPGNPAS